MWRREWARPNASGGIGLAAPYAQMLMKQVIAAVLGAVEPSVPEPRSERARKSAVAFVPERHAVVVVERRCSGASTDGTA